MTAEEFKAQGNKAFSSGDYQSAIKFFTQAIELDPSNHVLYSNRSAAYSSLKEYSSAADDAEKTVQLKPDWAKGYSRKGAALHGLGQLHEAADAYRKGLEFEPSNAQLSKGLQDVERAIESESLSGIGKVFGPDMWQKIAANPKLSPFLSQPDVVTKLQQIQQNPQNIAMAMQDQRIMQIMVGLMGLDATVATNQDELEQQKREAEENLERKRQEEQKKEEPAPVVEEETEEKKKRAASDEHKALGNASYKKRQFDDALKHYDAAWAADDTNLAVLTNKSAVLFEMEKYDECIKVCEEAVDIGRSMRADFKLIARALARIGSAYVKKDDLEQAIKFFQKSLSEHRTADTLEKLREVETLKKKKDLEAYIDPKLADEAREEGNNLFKNHDYAGSVKLYTEAVKRNPKDARNFSNRAAAYMKLMALPEAEKDCDEAIRLDENFVKAYIRKAAIQFTKREFTRCIETCNLASLKDPEGKHAAEIQQQIQKAYLANGQDNENLTPEQRYKKAMQDPEVAKIMSDPIMQQILQQMQEDPKAARDHLKNPAIAAKIQTLINAGIISTR